jgi:hypothetical protein
MNVPVPHGSPFMQLAAARARRNLRIAQTGLPRYGLQPARREVLARLRAAELAAWQANGGDFLHRPPAKQPSRKGSVSQLHSNYQP